MLTILCPTRSCSSLFFDCKSKNKISLRTFKMYYCNMYIMIQTAIRRRSELDVNVLPIVVPRYNSKLLSRRKEYKKWQEKLVGISRRLCCCRRHNSITFHSYVVGIYVYNIMQYDNWNLRFVFSQHARWKMLSIFFFRPSTYIIYMCAL